MSCTRSNKDTIKTFKSFNNASRHQIESECGQFTYHVAIIDYL